MHAGLMHLNHHLYLSCPVLLLSNGCGSLVTHGASQLSLYCLHSGLFQTFWEMYHRRCFLSFLSGVHEGASLDEGVLSFPIDGLES
ncbi:hypothetical protein ACB098_01G291100 [Castanea mollissima]